MFVAMGEKRGVRAMATARLPREGTRKTPEYCGGLGWFLEGQLLSAWRGTITPPAPSLPSTITSRFGASISGFGCPAQKTGNETGSDAATLTGRTGPGVEGAGIGTLTNLSVSEFGSQLIVAGLTRPWTVLGAVPSLD